MKKVLVVSNSSGGVHYYRCEKPHLKLQELYGEDFSVEFKNKIDINNLDELKGIDLLFFNQILVNFSELDRFFDFTKKNNIKVLMDLDDYWELPNTHPNYTAAKMNKYAKLIIEHIKKTDYVITTTNFFASIIKRYNSNVYVIPNGVDPKEKQFELKNKEREIVGVGWLGGSSHFEDLKILNGTINNLFSNDVKNKFQTVLCGFDLRGTKTIVDYLTDELAYDLRVRNMLNKETHKIVNQVQGQLHLIKNFPKDLVIKYKNYQPKRTQQPLQPTENVWYFYEMIFTDNHKIIKDKKYLNFLHEFKNKEYYDVDNQPYKRLFTKNINEYAKNYNEFDIALAPLVDNLFNKCKSNLKQIEAGFFKKPIICSDIVTYNEIGNHGENCFLVPKHKQKNWAKYIKQLINEKNLREDMGEKLYESVKDKYDLNNITKTRNEIYKEILSK